MSQPKWKYVGNIGDASPLEYGGFFVSEDTTGVYEAEAEIYDADEHKAWRFTLEQFKLFDFGLVHVTMITNPYRVKDGTPLENYANGEWWYDKLDDVCLSCDIDRDELIGFLCSDNPMQRAFAYRELVNYFGQENFDEYPLLLTEKEAKARYREMKAIGKWGRAL